MLVLPHFYYYYSCQYFFIIIVLLLLSLKFISQKFPPITITPKLNMLENDVCPFLRKWHRDFGFYREHMIEGIRLKHPVQELSSCEQIGYEIRANPCLTLLQEMGSDGLMKKNKYAANVHLNSKSEVEYAKCNCKAGAEGCYKHFCSCFISNSWIC